MAKGKLPPGRTEKTIVHHYTDHLVIEPPNRLRDRAQTIGGEDDTRLDIDAIARADAAMAALAGEFPDWMARTIDRLVETYETVRAGNQDAAIAQAAFYRAAHDLRGTATLYGYPVISKMAGSLCMLVERPIEDPRLAPLVDAHMLAIRRLHGGGQEVADSAIAGDIAEALEAGAKRIAAPQAEPEAVPDIDSPPLQAG